MRSYSCPLVTRQPVPAGLVSPSPHAHPTPCLPGVSLGPPPPDLPIPGPVESYWFGFEGQAALASTSAYGLAGPVVKQFNVIPVHVPLSPVTSAEVTGPSPEEVGPFSLHPALCSCPKVNR